jgi:hypothetical protein
MLPAVWNRSWRAHPMRRRVDDLEARALLVVAALVLTGSPAVGTAAGWYSYDHGRTVAATQEGSLRPVHAEVLTDAPDPAPWADEASRPVTLPVQARWTGADGEEVKGTIRVPPGTVRGERTEIWLNREGRVTPAPLNDRAIWNGAVTAGLFGVTLTASAGGLAAVAVRRTCSRRRAADWEREWSQVEPEWSRLA